MASPYLSQITMFGGNFAPKNYALCNGQLLSIQQNAALFSLLGTTYGGNGVNNFALPNLQSALPMSFGQGAGLSNYVLGQNGGVTSVTLTSQTVPSHQHFMLATKTSTANASAISTSVLPGTPTVSGADPICQSAATRPAGAHTAAVGGGDVLDRGQQPVAYQYDAVALHYLLHRIAGRVPEP